METKVDLTEAAERNGGKLRVLVTRLRFLGDVIITTPVLEALKDCYPESEIYYLSERKYALILRENPFIEGIIELEKGFSGMARALREIRGLNFTAAIDLFGNPRSANLLYLSGIGIRVGGSRKSRRMLYTHNVKTPDYVRSCVEHHLYSLRELGCDQETGDLRPRVYLSEREEEKGAEILEMLTGGGSDEKLIVAFHPGGTWQSKIWPADNFARLADMITENFHSRIILITGPGEGDITSGVRKAGSADIKVLPTLPIRTVAAVLSRCGLVVANDGGIMHLSVALGRPTVGVFGPTEPDIWFPYCDMGPFALATINAECAPCHMHRCDNMECMRGLEPRKVFDRIMEVCEESRYG